MKRALVLLGSLLVAGCSSNDTTAPAAAPDASVDATTASDAGVEAGARDAAPDAPVVYPAPCQTMIPIPGAPCPAGGIACEYGTDPRAVCWSFVTCLVPEGGSDLEWDDHEPPPGCTPANDPACPATFGSVATCPAGPPARCDYPEGRCACVGCQLADAGPGTNWGCRRWTDVTSANLAGGPDAACPSTRPHLGDACSVEGLACYYDGACTDIPLGPAMKCDHGYWVQAVDPGLACGARSCIQ